MTTEELVKISQEIKEKLQKLTQAQKNFVLQVVGNMIACDEGEK